MSEENKNKITKTEQNSIEAVNNQISVYNNQIAKSVNRLAEKYFDEAENLFFKYLGKGNPKNYAEERLRDTIKSNDLYLKVIELESDYKEDAYDGYARNLRLIRSEEHTSELQSRSHLVCRL